MMTEFDETQTANAGLATAATLLRIEEARRALRFHKCWYISTALVGLSLFIFVATLVILYITSTMDLHNRDIEDWIGSIGLGSALALFVGGLLGRSVFGKLRDKSAMTAEHCQLFLDTAFPVSERSEP